MQIQLQARSRRAAGSALYAAFTLLILGLGPACESGETGGETDSDGAADDEGSDEGSDEAGDGDGDGDADGSEASEGENSGDENGDSGDEDTAESDEEDTTEGDGGEDEDSGDGESSSSGDDDGASDDTSEADDGASDDASETGETTEGGDTADEDTDTGETEDDTGPGCRDEVADEIVAFEDSCLEWVRNVTAMQTQLPWSEVAGMSAGQACAMLDLEGGGWRLPTVEELETIVLRNNSLPAIDTEKFPGTPALLFWTSEENATSHKVTALDFSNNGMRLEVGPDGAQHYRCVRSSE